MKTKINYIAAGAAIISLLITLAFSWASFGFFTILQIIGIGILIAALFIGKRDIILAAGPLVLALISLITIFAWLGEAFHFFIGFVILLTNLLTFVAKMLLAGLAFSVTNEKYESYRKKLAPLWFLPGVVAGFAALINLFFSSVGFLTNVFLAATYFFTAMWIVEPFKDETNAFVSGGSDTGEQGGSYIGIGKHILLLLFTFGIWHLIWIYRTTEYCNRASETEKYSPVNKLLLCIFVPFYMIYWYYKHAQRVDVLARAKGEIESFSTTILILAIFIPIVAAILMQDKINKIETSAFYAPAAPAASANKTEDAKIVAEQLKTYQDLLASGAITQEEYDAKKKQILGL